MSSKDRKPYLSAATLTQDLLDACQDNLECRLEMIVDIEAPDGDTIHASDRNKYVGGTFYEALLNFPVIGRTVGEWLSNELQFSTLTLELSNVDGRFNRYLPGGDDYGNWIGKTVTVRLGLAEVSSTYTTIFNGKVTDVGGVKRSVKAITVIARDDYDRVNKSFPTTTLRESNYPKIEPKLIGKPIPVIYGDWTTATDPEPAAVPAYVVNSNDPMVTFKEKQITDVTAPTSVAIFTCADHDFDTNDPVELKTGGTLPAPFAVTTTYYIVVVGNDQFALAATPGGGAIVTTGAGTGEHSVLAATGATRRSVQCVVSSHHLSEYAATYLKRRDAYYLVASGVTTGTGFMTLTIAQGGTWVDGGPFEYESGDEFFVTVKGKSLDGYRDNLIEQAKDILITYGGLSAGDFDANWATYRDKASPAQSSISTIKSRAWIGETQQALSYALSMLEQVRLEAFISRDLKVKINSLHFEDWTPAPSFKIKNWDVVVDSFQVTIDDRNNFNAAQGAFNFLPVINENAYATAIYQNANAVTQVGKRIAKKLVFPNLYVKSDVVAQVSEILRLASASIESVSVQLTWRSLLRDIGDFVLIDVQVGSTIFPNVPGMIRDIGYDPVGLKIVAKLWSFAMAPFPGYTPGFAGTVGGYSATIIEET